MWYEDQTDYKGYLPDFYQDVKEIRKLDEILNERMDAFKEAVKGLADNVCAVTAREKGLARYEKILGIVPQTGENLSARRNKVLAKLLDKPPIHEEKVKEIAETYLGSDVDVELSKSGYTYVIAYRSQAKLLDAEPLKNVLRQILPANIAFTVEYMYTLWNEIPPTWNAVKQKTWDELRLGA